MGNDAYGFESILVHRIAFEEVWRVDLEAVASKVVDYKLTSIGQENERARRGLTQDRLTRLLLSSRPKTSVR